MIKKVIMLAILLFPVLAMAQNEEDKKQTKYEEFVSKTGIITKFVDTKMEKCFFNVNESFKVTLRMVYGEVKNHYFLILEEGTFMSGSHSSAHIEYSDLVEINKAFAKLLSEVDADRELRPEYLQNIFTSVDGFSVGYYVEKSKVKWIIKLRHGADKISFKQPMEIANYLLDAQKKIESIMAQNGK